MLDDIFVVLLQKLLLTPVRALKNAVTPAVMRFRCNPKKKRNDDGCGCGDDTPHFSCQQQSEWPPTKNRTPGKEENLRQSLIVFLFVCLGQDYLTHPPSLPHHLFTQHTDSSDTDEREQQQQRQEGGGTTSDKHNNTFSPSLNEFDKEDRRRNPMGRFIAFLERPFVAAIRRRRQQKLKEDSEYYEDSYNDLSWRCSFGTTEDVSNSSVAT